MNKLNINIYKGIEFVQLKALPAAEAAALMRTLDERTLIKILIDDVILSDCVLFSAYESWFASYSKEVNEPVVLRCEGAIHCTPSTFVRSGRRRGAGPRVVRVHRERPSKGA